MTKEDKQVKDTKTVNELVTFLKWRLNNKLTLNDVTKMLEKNIIDEKEAKQLLFNEVTETESEKEKALVEQIKFLEEVIEKLTTNRNWGWVNTYAFYPAHSTRYWVTGTGVGNIYTFNATSNAVGLSSTLTSPSNTLGTGTMSYS
jgi:DNA-binding transcriptional MerR regulator